MRSDNQNMLLSQGILNVVGALMAIGMWVNVAEPAFYIASGLTIFSGVATIFFLRQQRNHLSDRAASFFFAANLVPVSCLLWTSTEMLSKKGGLWIPFEAYELSCLTVALLAPPLRKVGITAILVFAAMPCFHYFGFSAEEMVFLPQRALAAPIAFCVFGLILYLSRLRSRRISHFAAKKAAEAQAMVKMARTLIAIKDLANSPLQILIADSEILKKKYPIDSPIATRIGQAAQKLGRLNQILDENLQAIPTGVAHASFDAYEALKVEDVIPEK